MSAEIEFGNSRQREPTCGPRPETNPLLSVRRIGRQVDEEFDVYIDLDTWRDLWEHATSDLTIELGGILVGRAHCDDKGRNFVVVQGNIRAEHYEASRGSFKFTHESWREITRKQQALPADMVIVGWYHTHPGFGVFLSSMDEFICHHFFNGSHDVALVIDPRRKHCGWFVRNKAVGLRQTAGYFLTTHRQRQSELASLQESVPHQPAVHESAASLSLLVSPLENRANARDGDRDKGPHEKAHDDAAHRDQAARSMMGLPENWLSRGPGLFVIGLQSLAIIVLASMLWIAKSNPTARSPADTSILKSVAEFPRSSHDLRRRAAYRDLLADTLGYDVALTQLTATAAPPPAVDETVSTHPRQNAKPINPWTVVVGSSIVVMISLGCMWWLHRQSQRSSPRRSLFRGGEQRGRDLRDEGDSP